MLNRKQGYKQALYPREAMARCDQKATLITFGFTSKRSWLPRPPGQFSGPCTFPSTVNASLQLVKKLFPLSWLLCLIAKGQLLWWKHLCRTRVPTYTKSFLIKFSFTSRLMPCSAVTDISWISSTKFQAGAILTETVYICSLSIVCTEPLWINPVKSRSSSQRSEDP